MDKYIVYINEAYEEDSEMALYDVENDEIVLNGDHYHHKIMYLIKGYLIAKGLNFEDIKKEYIKEDNPMFDRLGFYSENY